MTRRQTIALVVGLIALPQAYGVAQSYNGRSEIAESLYQDCLAEAFVRANLAADPHTPPPVAKAAAALTKPTAEGRRALCRASHPRPDFKPF